MSNMTTLSETVNMILGAKGADVFVNTGDPRLDLSVATVRGACPVALENAMTKVLDMGTPEAVEDAVVLTFIARDVRQGKGERDASYTLFRTLWYRMPELMRSVLPLLPEYGSWRDVVAMAITLSPSYTDAAIELIATQLLKDEVAERPSLCAKWSPREKKKGDALARRLAHFIWKGEPEAGNRMMRYRKLVAGINRRIDTVEIRMANKDWASIKPGAVPGRALQLYNRAFLNLVSTSEGGRKVTLSHDAKSAVRFPDDEDRVACATHFTEHFAAAAKGKAKVNGADTVQPHEIVKKAMDIIDSRGAQAEKDQLNAVWSAIVAKTAAGGGLEDAIVMCDFSGSMQSAGSQGDLPYWVSLAMGILASYVCKCPKIMSFDSTPTWHTFPEGDLFERLQSISGHLGKGLSTDFQAAFELIVADIKKRRAAPGTGPKTVIVFTDMNFDAAKGSEHGYRHHVKTAPQQTHFQMAKETFRRLGEDMYGDAEAFPAPTLVIWNLAAGPTDFQATADEPGVAMLSGWSPTQFAILQKEGPRQMTAYETLRVELDSPRYEPVRECVRSFVAAGKVEKE